MRSTSNQKRILLIDDDEVDIMGIISEFKKLLSPEIPDINFHFDTATNGIEALDKLYGQNGQTALLSPDAILVDIRMPKMGGIDFLKKLRLDSTFDKIPVYLLTALYGTDEKLATLDLKITGRIIKPLQHDDALHVYMKIIGMLE